MIKTFLWVDESFGDYYVNIAKNVRESAIKLKKFLSIYYEDNYWGIAYLEWDNIRNYGKIL